MVCQSAPKDVPACFDLSVFNDSTSIPPDPDIAGIGVIASFVISAGIALALTFVYVLLDHVHLLRMCIDAEFWQNVLEKVVLSLSDTQLVTGLAILVVAFVRWDEITVYHWEIISDLAFISSNTHIATLVILRKYFRHPRNWWVRLSRITIMVAMAVLLFVANAYSGYVDWDDSTAWPMRCVASELKKDLSGNFRGEPRLFMAVWSVFLLTNYPIAILALFERVSARTRSFIDEAFRVSVIELAQLKDTGKLRRKYGSRAATRQHGTFLREAWYCVKISFFFVLRLMHSDPFFILEDTFWYIFNLYYLFQWRQDYRCDLAEIGKEDEISGFGQILPLILLLLPLMAFSEAYVDQKP